METNNFFNYPNVIESISTFAFVIILASILAIACITIVGLIEFFKCRKEKIAISRYKIDLEAEVIKQLGELVKVDNERNMLDNQKGRKYVYTRSGDVYEFVTTDESDHLIPI